MAFRLRNGLALMVVFLLLMPHAADAEEVESVTVKSVESISATLSDSRRLVLAGIDPMRETGFENRLAGAFKTAVQQSPVQIIPVRPHDQWLDRHGRLPVLILSRDEPLQLYLLRNGLTRFVGFNGVMDDRLRTAFLAAEAVARTAKEGLWRDPRFAVFTTETVPQRDGFAVVEGVPLVVARTRSMVYLNFGDDWRTDFTVGIEPGLLKSAPWVGWDIETLVGRPLRLRGWLRRYNGAFMTLTHPDQIEILEDED